MKKPIILTIVNILLFPLSLYPLYVLLVLGKDLDKTGTLIILIISLWSVFRVYYKRYVKERSSDR